MKSHSAMDVARWFLQRNDFETVDNGGELLTNQKLQKLLYYAQGVFLALAGHSLFEENIVAWAYGPAVEKVYDEFHCFESNGIVYGEFFRPQEEYTQEEKNLLNQVFDCFGQYATWKLCKMSREERPWKETRMNYTISRQLMQEYFYEEYIDEDEEGT